jgi:hypothetical protein
MIASMIWLRSQMSGAINLAAVDLGIALSWSDQIALQDQKVFVNFAFKKLKELIPFILSFLLTEKKQKVKTGRFPPALPFFRKI